MTGVVHARLPDIVTGYAIDAPRGWWAVIIPESGTNILRYPSMGRADDMTAFGTSAADRNQSDGIVSRHLFSYKMEPTNTAVAGAYAEFTAAVDTYYTFSADIYGNVGETYSIYVADTSATPGSAVSPITTVNGKGKWERASTTYREATGATRRAYIRRNAPGLDLAPASPQYPYFYTDGWQVEALPYPTTFISEDELGFSFDLNEYYASGGSHFRVARTRSGGKFVPLRDLDFHTLSVMGLGMGPWSPQTTTLATQGDVYLSATRNINEFTIAGRLHAEHIYDLHKKRADLISYFRPDETHDQQQIMLYYQPLDADGNPSSEPLYIPAVFLDGLQGQIDNWYAENLALRFSMYELPYEEFDGNGSLSFRTSLTNNGVLERSPPNGNIWNTVGTGATNGAVNAVRYAQNGDIFVAGAFTTISGTAANRIGIYDVDNGTWAEAADSVDGLNDVVRDAHTQITFNFRNDIFLAGDFTTDNAGVPNNIRRAARYDISTDIISEVDTGLNGASHSVMAHPNGIHVYWGGDFTAPTSGAPAATTRIVRYDFDGTAWESIPVTPAGGAGQSEGLNGIVHAITLGPDGDIYMGGAFTGDSAGTGDYNRVVRFNVDLDTWEQITVDPSNPVATNGLNGIVRALAFGPDGFLYAGGDFTADLQSPANTMARLARWTGSKWEEVGGGVNGSVNALGFTSDGVLHVGGDFTAGAVGLPAYCSNYYAAIAGDNWIPMEVNIPGQGVTDFHTGDIFNEFVLMGLDYITGTSFDTMALTTITYTGTAETHPWMSLTGQGRVTSIINDTSKTRIDFNVDLFSEESIFLDLRQPGRFELIGEFGEIESKILPTSNLTTFRLLPGDNQIRLLIDNSDGSTGNWLKWKIKHHGIDGVHE